MATPTSATGGKKTTANTGGTPVQTAQGTTQNPIKPGQAAKKAPTPTGGTKGAAGQLLGSFDTGFQYVQGPPQTATPAKAKAPAPTKAKATKKAPAAKPAPKQQAKPAPKKATSPPNPVGPQPDEAVPEGPPTGGGGEAGEAEAPNNLMPPSAMRGGMVRDRQNRRGGAELIDAHEGEFVVNREATRKHKPLLTKINKAGLRGRARLNGPPARAKFVPGKTLF